MSLNIDYNEIANKYLQNGIELINGMEISGYPLDIIHDITFIIEEKPKIALFLCKEKYVSTTVIELHTDIISYHQDDKYQSESYIRMIDYILTNLNDWKYADLLFYGVFHDYDMKYEHNTEHIKTLLNFFRTIYKRKMDIYFKEEPEEEQTEEQED